MPFADYDDFDDCVEENGDKGDPEAYCAAIERSVKGELSPGRDVSRREVIRAIDGHEGELLAQAVSGWFGDDGGVEFQQNDEDRVCGDLWFNGTSDQRSAFGNGTEGRGRDERPPQAWWEDCQETIGASLSGELDQQAPEGPTDDGDDGPASDEETGSEPAAGEDAGLTDDADEQAAAGDGLDVRVSGITQEAADAIDRKYHADVEVLDDDE